MGSTGGPNHDPDSVELPHPPGEDARPMEVGHKLKDPSAAPRGPTAPPEYIPATTKPPPGQGYTANLSSRPPSLPGDSKALSEILTQVAAEILNEPSDLGWGPESQAQPDSFLWEDSDSEESQPEDPDTVSLLCASPRSGEPLENGQPPPRVRGPRSKTRGLRHKLLGLLPPKGENLKASLLGPVPVHPVPMERTEDGLQMRVACDEPQREQRFQPEGGNFVGVMSSSPFVLGNVVDARPLSTQPLSSISSSDKGKAQQKTGSGDIANSSGDGVRLENFRKPSAQSQRTGVTSPVYPDPEQKRDDDKNPLLVKRPLSRGNSGPAFKSESRRTGRTDPPRSGP